MNNIVTVRICQCIGNSCTNTSSRNRCHAALAAQCFRQRATLHEFHRHEIGVAGLAPVVDAHDVRVVQASNALGLAAKALHKVRVNGMFGEQNLHRHVAVKQQVAGQEHISHSAATDTPRNLVALVNDLRILVRHTASRGYPCCLWGCGQCQCRIQYIAGNRTCQMPTSTGAHDIVHTFNKY